MIDIIKKSLKPFDYLILVAAIILFSSMDYNNLDIVNKIYIVTFFVWFVLLVIRIYIIHQGAKDK